MAGSRLGLRFSAFRSAFRQQPRLGGFRFVQTATEGSKPTAEQAGFSWSVWAYGPTGVKTVHFWAPVMKWAIVIAGISDLARPAESLSLSQNGALTATGVIWTRWCLIIKPRNILLATVNFFLGVVGAVQVGRIFNYRQSDEYKESQLVAKAIDEVASQAVQVAEVAEVVSK